MKNAVYRIFKPAVFQRAVQLKAKQEARLQRLQEVMDYLNEWSEAPLTTLFTPCCEKLNISPTNAAKGFITGLCFGSVDINKEARKLPLT